MRELSGFTLGQKWTSVSFLQAPVYSIMIPVIFKTTLNGANYESENTSDVWRRTERTGHSNQNNGEEDADGKHIGDAGNQNRER